MTIDDLNLNILNWIKTTLAIETIFSHGTGPRPKGTYAVLNLMSITKPIADDNIEVTREINADIKAQYSGIRKAMYSINIYRDDSTSKMATLRSSLDKITTQDYFNILDIGILSPSDVRRIPEQIGKAWENRSQADFFFHIVNFEVDADISEIKQIELTNDIDDTTTIIS